MYCRQEDVTGVFRSSQCIEYKERLDECSVPVRRLNEEPAVRPPGNHGAIYGPTAPTNSGFSTVAGRLSGRRSFVHAGRFFFRGVNS